MNECMLLTCGANLPAGVDAMSDGVRTLVATEAPLRTASGEVLDRAVQAANGEFLAFADAESVLDGAACRMAIEALAGQPNAAAALIPFDPADLFWKAWQALPASVVVLIAPPEAFAWAVVRKADYRRIGPFEKAPHPLWQWLVRSVEAGRPIVRFTAAEFPRAAVSVHDLPELVPQSGPRRADWLISRLDEAADRSLAGRNESAGRKNSEPDVAALKAGLYQIHDALDESHQLAQSIEGRGRHRAGDYWHAIMHRREPDYSNSKYWFRSVGRHPIFEALAERAARTLDELLGAATGWRNRLVDGGWDPFAFVDLCAECADAPGSPLAAAARRIQFDEMLLLLLRTYEDAASA